MAILLSPIVALEVERRRDANRAKLERKVTVYRDLLRTRGIRLDAVHVSALNLVDLEFYDDVEIRRTLKDYIRHLSSPMPAVEDQDRYFEQREDLFLELLQIMGQSLGYNFDKQDLRRLSYIPLGWENDQKTQRQNSQLLNEVLSGMRAFPVASLNSTGGPFPAPPED
ncbi:hypothetical protein O4G76_19355 [Limimaricola sp. G21655-S1]|nr:hypothetical protein [Limimaricola sp. G21655-S1]